MDTEKIASNFKLFSKPVPPVFDRSVINLLLSQVLYLVIFVAVCLALYYYKENVYSGFRQLWIYAHLNKNGELASVYVPSEFDIRNWF
jgi:hypothetical protein